MIDDRLRRPFQVYFFVIDDLKKDWYPQHITVFASNGARAREVGIDVRRTIEGGFR